MEAYFAQLDDNNVVLNIITVNENDIKDENGNVSEQIGIDFCKSLVGAHTNWVQTFKDDSKRVRYATIGGTYNEEYDAFILAKPYESWILNLETLSWESPLSPPNPPYEYRWEERLYKFDNTKGWVHRYGEDFNL